MSTANEKVRPEGFAPGLQHGGDPFDNFSEIASSRRSADGESVLSHQISIQDSVRLWHSVCNFWVLR